MRLLSHCVHIGSPVFQLPTAYVTGRPFGHPDWSSKVRQAFIHSKRLSLSVTLKGLDQDKIIKI